MARRLRITLDGVEAVARLHENAAPKTVVRLWAALPLEERLRHVRWSGDAGYRMVSKLADSTHLADNTHTVENPVSFYPSAGIVFRWEHGEIAFCYGQAQARDHMRVAAWACHVGTLEDNAAAFLDKVQATASEGAKPIRLAREAEG
jgi:hypothetical protein